MKSFERGNGYVWTLEGGQTVTNCHAPGTCAGRTCALHNPSNHAMRHFKQNWRSDRGLLERICPHGIGHPDPDHLAYVLKTRSLRDWMAQATHGCDGCCDAEYGKAYKCRD